MPIRLAGAVLAVAAAASLAGCGGSPSAGAAPSNPLVTGAVQIVPELSLSSIGPAARTAAERALPSPWAVSFDARLAARSELEIELGGGAAPVLLSRGSGPGERLRVHGGTYTLARRPGWLGGESRHLEATRGRLAIDGRSVAIPAVRGTRLSFRIVHGSARINALIISDAADRASLLFHRLAELHARLAPRTFPIGADVSDRLHSSSTYWTTGFWPGALWQAAALEPGGGLFARWALAATIGNFGQERRDTHDVGFMYGQSSLAAWTARCRRPGAPARLCVALEHSVLSAADELRVLAASNPGRGTIPTNAVSPEADTIVDSMMNIAILPWASRVTGNPLYAQVASRHAHVVAALLVRSDGSTAQSVNLDRATGRVLFISTHQGLSNASTWSRGEGWAVYGFAQAAADLRDRGLLRVALRTAGYVALHLPAGMIPRWDYDAPSGAPVDVSAGVITAAGLLHLAAACRSLPGVCPRPARWAALARRMLAAALTRAEGRPPLGFLGSQALDERVHGCWCNGGELIFGLSYALEALKLERTPIG